MDAINGSFVRVLFVWPSRSESAISVEAKSAPANDRFGDLGLIATMNVLQVRKNAAPAIATLANGSNVRVADVDPGPASACCRRKLPFALEVTVQ